MTFLVTSKMSPELAARVEASVRGRKSKEKRHLARWTLRLAIPIAIVLAITAGVRAEQRVRHDREHARALLLQAIKEETASLTAEDLQTVARVETWLVRLAGAYEGDLVAEELKKPDGLRSALSRSAIYFRGPHEELTTSARIGTAASVSLKDALLYCLVDPPASRSEKVVLAKVRGTQGAVANVHRLYDAHAGISYFLPQWAGQVTAARDIGEIAALATRFEKAPLREAKEALRAELLIAAIDDTASGSGPTELDGARAHDVRVAIVDLRASKPLLRLKKRMDPSWISTEHRPRWASPIDGCALALDVRGFASPR